MGKEEDDKIYKSTFTFGFNPELLKLVNDARARTRIQRTKPKASKSNEIKPQNY